MHVTLNWPDGMAASSKPPSGLRTQQAALARATALEAAIDVLRNGELDTLTMHEIAQATGLSLRTLYRYVPTREDLPHAAGQRSSRNWRC